MCTRVQVVQRYQAPPPWSRWKLLNMGAGPWEPSGFSERLSHLPSPLLVMCVFVCFQFPLPPFLPHTPCLPLPQIHSSLLSLQKGAGLLGTPTEHVSPLFLTDTKIPISILLMYSFAFFLFRSEFAWFFLCSICIGFLCFSGHGIKTLYSPHLRAQTRPKQS